MSGFHDILLCYGVVLGITYLSELKVVDKCESSEMGISVRKSTKTSDSDDNSVTITFNILFIQATL
ncbi:hypothetical protein PAECIP112173_01477 [Paenibacillus sp. JJ-100]|nr:hypothetical protein PAECIP112173_01477 [Paenibacillus sp. JJ-100]